MAIRSEDRAVVNLSYRSAPTPPSLRPPRIQANHPPQLHYYDYFTPSQLRGWFLRYTSKEFHIIIFFHTRRLAEDYLTDAMPKLMRILTL